ncbi:MULTISPECIES: nickel pincer cofactor biosynthesis protein LarB [Prochlorococcus]|uniref:Circadian phase modifier CpmA homolog n=1 Tax=Prochlorococcus marinus (strain SARG / CCMP1375 / SS120) TaxID=167539 RepID=Q7VAV1_PROMA|nr:MULTISPECIES: nickel pincer cofactor biosynthesis protein LarB [Prochlorococcus]AAQ00396.1 Circadian phase modifier CpmA homolog [Prochlorococcus marinus subsp. marinus str. CCMP1375]KGG14277.1 Circadian phase modifier [Prochlorococcus marinus str. LG]KGG22150.1 Circadian phase modifier [Prochlorococcus marinus str. SS2]KGG24532.1 Circadian phase modifier [Prochlorococcus marinus str. SS35]KGG33427.1 Circadian phase modifier [Prochlorococcus marinus str. SS51]
MIEKEFKLDHERLKRLGMVEAIWGQHKSYEQICEILRRFQATSQMALVTRVDNKKAEKILDTLESVQYHSQASCLTLGSPLDLDPSLGEVLVVSGGTSDVGVAAEAELSLRMHGIQTDCLMDIGVAGLHRLLGKLERFTKARVVIVCAGMEGSLPTVIAGLIPQPVIGLPVSVGYGVSGGGNASLLSMLSSCSPGLLVVNIDNGYGAAMAALRIIKSDLFKKY